MSAGSRFHQFQGIPEKSTKECGNELKRIDELVYKFLTSSRSLFKHTEFEKIFPNLQHSLAFVCYLELNRISLHISFLALNGLYRNAFDDIRHVLESIVQALYIDFRHPKIDIKTKTEILKEVEDKREYHAVRLIDELKIDQKEKLRQEYKKLSKIIHPSHKQIVAIMRDIDERKGVPVTVDCREISRIYDSMRTMYDIFLFLFISSFPEVKKLLKKNPDFIELIKVYNLPPLSRVFK